MKAGLCPQLAAVGDMVTCYGTVKRVDGQFLQERQEQDQYDFVGVQLILQNKQLLRWWPTKPPRLRRLRTKEMR